jgi:hypothetical protein
MNSATLTVVFRHYREDKYASRSRDPRKVRPSWFTNALCFKSVLMSIKDYPNAENIRLIIWYDGSQEDVETDPLINFAKINTGDIPCLIIRKDYSQHGRNAGEAISWLEMTTYIIENANTSLFYFIENDYLHLRRAISCIFELLSDDSSPAYLSLADHLDYYHLPAHTQHQTKLIYTKNYLFKEMRTTTGTFAVRAKEFKEDLPVFLESKGDFIAFNRLTGLLGRRLAVVIPSLAAHCMSNLLPPAVDWQGEANIIENI